MAKFGTLVIWHFDFLELRSLLFDYVKYFLMNLAAITHQYI
jgi:hypothetical protein